jgi:uncharacterized damage-inducible protein DinB
MDTQTAKLFAEYNRTTNQQMNALIARLGPEQWERRFDGYYPTIRALCNHLYVADFIWLKRLAGLRPFRYAEDELFEAQLTLSSSAFSSQDEYLVKRTGLDAKLTAFAAELTAEDFAQPLVYKNFKGTEQRRNVGGLVLHLFNHGTHHRGMISLYLDSLGVENDFSNLFLLV